jgi:hypothetical protein
MEKLWRGDETAPPNEELDLFLTGLKRVRWWEAPSGAFELLCDRAGTSAVARAISLAFS